MLLVDEHLPGASAGHVWGKPTVRLGPGDHQLRFVSLFDWEQLALREARFLEVVIQRLDAHPSLVGHHALIEAVECRITLVVDGASGAVSEESGLLQP